MKHHRRSIRLKEWDYTQPGAYFVTICTHQRVPLFGRVVDGEMVLNPYGEIVRACWREIPDHFQHVEWDAFVVMPNHVHGIIVIVGVTHASPLQRENTPPRGPASGSLGAIVGSFKSAVTKRINQMRGTPGARVWQRNYYEHIIRNAVRASGRSPLHAIRRYIVENPLRWRLGRYNPDAPGPDPRGRPAGSPLPWRMLQTDARAHPHDPAPCPKSRDDQETRL